MERKIYVSPPGVLRFGVLFGVTLYLWNFFRSYLLFLALLLIAVSPVVSLLLLLAGRKELWARAELPGRRMGRDTAFSFDIIVYNPGKFAAYTADIVYSFSNVFTGYSEQRKQHLWIAPVVGSQIEQTLSSRYAGRIEAHIEAFEVFDLLHIFSLRDCARQDASALVWPAFAEAADEEISSVVEGFPLENETKKRGVDYNPDYEVREYIPGDELKSIHWKLSAKQERLMVRERLSAGRDQISLLLPLGKDRSRNDALVEALYALGRLLLGKGYPLRLYWEAGEGLREYFAAEGGELDLALAEILSGCGLHEEGVAQAQMALLHPKERYILIQTGAYRGAYIR